MMEKLWNSKYSQREKDRQMQIVFISLTTILIMIFLTPFYLLATDPQAPHLTYQSSVVENFRVSANQEYFTSDLNFNFSVENTDKVYSFLYEFINADIVDADRDVVVASNQHKPFSQGTNTATDIVLKFRKALFSISEWTENELSKGGKGSGKANVSISMGWKLRINGGCMPRQRYTGLNVNCAGTIEFSFNNSSGNAEVNFLPADDEPRCDAHLDRVT